jgi:hypothetical protein
VRPTTHAGALVREAGSLNDAYRDLFKPATAHRKRNEESGLARRRGKPSLDVLGSAAGARLDPARKNRACGTQEGQTVCGLAKTLGLSKATVITVSSFCQIRLHIQGMYMQALVNLSARRSRLFCNQGTSGRMKDYRCPL